MADPLLLEQKSEMAEHDFATRVIDDLATGGIDAPYGVRADGTPRGKPGPKPSATGTRANRSRGRTRARPSSPPKRPAAKSKAAEGPNYAAGIRGILQMVAAPLAMAGVKNPALALDAATISLHAGPVSEGVAEGAMELPQLQMILDRVLAVGPWGMVIAPVLALGAQIMANHGVIPVGMMGTVGPELLVAEMQRQADEMMAGNGVG